MSRFGDELIEALEEAVAIVEGKQTPARVHHVVVIEPSDVVAIRKRFGLTREEFASRFGLDARAVQDWEQGRRKPDRAARVLLRRSRSIPRQSRTLSIRRPDSPSCPKAPF